MYIVMRPLAALALTTLALHAVAFAEETGKVYPTAAETKPLKAGEKAPDAPLKTAEGEATSVHKLAAESPIALVFYRGGWCPYCSKHLEALKDAIEPLKELGYAIVAVSPDSPENTKKAAEEFDLPYALVSDDGVAAAKAFGIAFPSDYKHLVQVSGGLNTESLLPVPSVFLIEKDGTIAWVHSDPDFKKRLSADDLVAAAKKSAAE